MVFDVVDVILDLVEAVVDASDIGTSSYKGRQDPEAMATNWICPCCKKRVKYVKHCACGYDFNPKTDKMLSIKPFTEITESDKPVAHIEKMECPCCGAIVKADDATCFNCGTSLKKK